MFGVFACTLCIPFLSEWLAEWIRLRLTIQARLCKLSEKDDSGLDVGYKRKIGVKSDVMFWFEQLGR